ncbi:hypothetical protein [Clostridium sp. ZS2-4]|uniref:hypothetical protein n=1 Tax=Clostridium sp. ZS2-4 TaxID=2987703 RepID=UPI00227A2540|nr:hypothetical protein [Clostridium sp. ZS2-4]MCY6354432.1 hypothetical protein [Clostridium sp. ZS2-4]
MVVQVANEVKRFFNNVIGKECRILTVIKEGEDWRVVCEADLDKDYTVRKGMGEIVEIYEVFVNDNLDILGYELNETKKKAQLYERD